MDFVAASTLMLAGNAGVTSGAGASGSPDATALVLADTDGARLLAAGSEAATTFWGGTTAAVVTGGPNGGECPTVAAGGVRLAVVAVAAEDFAAADPVLAGAVATEAAGGLETPVPLEG
jgi:hypothetical protein